MMNLELARIVTAERRRETTNALRQAAFRADLAEREADRKKTLETCPPHPGTNAGLGAKPALGSSR